MANAFIRDNTAGRGAMDTVCIPYNNPEVFYRAMATCEDFPNYPNDTLGHLLSHELAHTIGMDHSHGWGNKFGHTDESLCMLDEEEKNNGLESIMRQHQPVNRRVWSICNRCDLLISYQKQLKEHGKYCMQDNVKDLGDLKPTNTEENPVTTSETNPGTSLEITFIINLENI